jgi:hypothetical protein
MCCISCLAYLGKTCQIWVTFLKLRDKTFNTSALAKDRISGILPTTNCNSHKYSRNKQLWVKDLYIAVSLISFTDSAQYETESYFTLQNTVVHFRCMFTTHYRNPPPHRLHELNDRTSHIGPICIYSYDIRKILCRTNSLPAHLLCDLYSHQFQIYFLSLRQYNALVHLLVSLLNTFILSFNHLSHVSWCKIFHRRCIDAFTSSYI